MPDDGDAPRLIARLCALDPDAGGYLDVQSWIEAASPTVFPADYDASSDVTDAFGAVAFGTASQNTLPITILVSGSCIVTAATAGVVNLGVGDTNTPDVDPITPAITVAAATVVPFSAVVPPNSYLLLTHTGTITVGSPVCVASAVTALPAS